MSDPRAQQEVERGGLIQGLGASAAGREVNLTAVMDDMSAIQERLTHLCSTVDNLNDHLMGNVNLKKERLETGRIETDETPAGLLPQLCDLGNRNMSLIARIQEKVNQLSYELGEGNRG